MYEEQIVTFGLGIVGMSILLACCYATFILCRRHRSSGVFILCASSLLMSFGFALESVSWAILTKGWGALSMDDQPQWNIRQAIGDIPYYLIFAGLVVLPLSMFILARNLHSAKIEPTDIVSAGLRDLIRDSISSKEDAPENTEETPPPTPVDPDKLVGTWVSTVADDGTITLVLTEKGDFTWSFDKIEKSGTLTGEFGIYNANLFVLMSDDSQMVGEVTFVEDSELSFILAGGPQGDPGLHFVRKP